MKRLMSTASAALHDLAGGYDPADERRPLAAYAALSATSGMTLAGALAALHASVCPEDRA